MFSLSVGTKPQVQSLIHLSFKAHDGYDLHNNTDVKILCSLLQSYVKGLFTVLDINDIPFEANGHE